MAPLVDEQRVPSSLLAFHIKRNEIRAMIKVEADVKENLVYTDQRLA